MKVVFMGTPDFAVPCLEKLYEKCYNICAVFTNPDKPKGRKQELSQSPVKKKALNLGLDVFQPGTLKSKSVQKIVEDLAPDVIVVVAYGKILPKSILEVPSRGCINVHGSLLPKYRGAAPIQWSVINGDDVTGITTMYMNEGLDTGDIILQKSLKIGPDETSGELFDRLCGVGADLLVETMDMIESGSITRTKQIDELSSYAPMLDKSMSKIDFNKSSIKVHNLVRGLNPWPGALATFDGKVLKVHKTQVVNGYKGAPGSIVDEKNAIVMCADNTAIKLLQVQPAGKKLMSGEDFIRGQNKKNMKDFFDVV